MRANDDYFDHFDDGVIRGAPRLQRMIKEERHRRRKARSGYDLGPADEWDADLDSYDDYDDEYPDYNEEEFDRHALLR
jgi:hypothetical protein